MTSVITSQTIMNFVETVYLVQRVVGKGQSGHLRDTARMMGRYLEREATLDDLNAATVNNFLRSLEERLALSSLVSRRGHLLAIMQAANDAGLIPAVPVRTIRKYRRNTPRPSSWTTAEVDRLISASRKLKGEHKGILRSVWWEAYIRTAYDTGLRPVDLDRLTLTHFDQHGVVGIDQHKTGKLVIRRVQQSTLDAIRKINRPLLFGGYIGKDQRSYWFHRIMNLAGLTGNFYDLRSTCGTLVEMHFPAQGHIALGNGRAVFERHNYDRKITRETLPMPPKLAD